MVINSLWAPLEAAFAEYYGEVIEKEEKPTPTPPPTPPPVLPETPEEAEQFLKQAVEEARRRGLPIPV